MYGELDAARNPFRQIELLSASPSANRREECRRVLDNVMSLGGTSTLIIGDHQAGKSDILHAVANRVEESRHAFPGRLVCTHIEGLNFGVDGGPADFWSRVLRQSSPNGSIMSLPSIHGAIVELARAQYRGDGISQFADALHDQRIRLVIFIDDFDGLLGARTLVEQGFFTSLRSVAKSRGSIVLVVTSQSTQFELECSLASVPRFDSPPFNFFRAEILGPLSDKAVDEILSAAGRRFSRADRQFVLAVGGGLPFLTKQLSIELWDSYLEFPSRRNGAQRRNWTARRLLAQVHPIFSVWWRRWTPANRVDLIKIVLRSAPQHSQFHAAPSEHVIQGEILSLASVARLLQDCCSREESRIYLQEVEGIDSSGFPSKDQPDSIYFHDFALVLARQGGTRRYLEVLRQHRPGRAIEINKLLHTNGTQLIPGVVIGHMFRGLVPTPFDLERRGLLKTVENCRWSIRPAVFAWWLVERLSPLFDGAVSIRRWMLEYGLSGFDDTAIEEWLGGAQKMRAALDLGTMIMNTASGGAEE